MKKIKNILLLAVAAMSLSGCEALSDLFGGGEDDDTTIYHTTIKIEGVPTDLLTANNYKVKAVTYHDGEGEDEIIANDPQYNEVDATYQSRVDLTAPFIPGYKFLGWDVDGGQLVGLDDTDPSDGYYMFWNQFQKNGTVKAKYQHWIYQIQYNFDDNTTQKANGNPTSYDPAAGVCTLSPATTTNSAKEEFVQWYYYKHVNEQSVKTVITELPRDYFEDTNFMIYGEFKTFKYNFKVVLDDGVTNIATVSYPNELYNDGTANPHVTKVSDYNWNIDYGEYVSILVTFLNPQAQDEIYVYRTFAGGAEEYCCTCRISEGSLAQGVDSYSVGHTMDARNVTYRFTVHQD